MGRGLSSLLRLEDDPGIGHKTFSIEANENDLVAACLRLLYVDDTRGGKRLEWVGQVECSDPVKPEETDFLAIACGTSVSGSIRSGLRSQSAVPRAPIATIAAVIPLQANVSHTTNARNPTKTAHQKCSCVLFRLELTCENSYNPGGDRRMIPRIDELSDSRRGRGTGRPETTLKRLVRSSRKYMSSFGIWPKDTCLEKERIIHFRLRPCVHEAYLRLREQRTVDWRNRAQLLGTAANMMRRVLKNHAVARSAQKRGGNDPVRVTLDEAVDFYQRCDISVAAVDEALDELEKLDPRQSQIVELRFFAGLTIEEIAKLLEISPATVKREWTTAKLWLQHQLSEMQT